MGLLKIVAIVLIAAGVLGLIYGGVTYTKETHEAKIGPFELSVEDRETVNIPMWASAAAILAGVVLLATHSRRK